MTNSIVQPRQFIEPGLGVSTYLDFGARLFSMQWPTYGAHILQGLLWYLVSVIHSKSIKRNPVEVSPPFLSIMKFPTPIKNDSANCLDTINLFCLFLLWQKDVCLSGHNNMLQCQNV